jgi:broad specificity phosphatase PhoE
VGDVLGERHRGTVPTVPGPLHLVRHGEVENPDHLCYADLPGFSLSPRGRRQAAAAANRLATVAGDEVAVVTSPLERAVETAAIIAAELGTRPVTDERLGEWSLSMRWAGVAWEDLPRVFPGELEAYLAHPHELAFAPESLAAVADRMTAAVADTPPREVVVVSHQDPLQALRLRLSGRSLRCQNEDKPRHCEILTLRAAGNGWEETERWTPE